MLIEELLVPEVVQTSNMDCGPAALKCLLEGHGIPVSYGRLREACQTGIDGASIDTMETVAGQLGLQAEQMILPVDHLVLPEAKALPALVVVTLPNGLTHFVVVWRRHGSLLQIMDPAVGRRWVSAKRFSREVYRHAMPVAAALWREFAASEDFACVLRARFTRLLISQDAQRKLFASALGDETWRSIASLDAALRLVQCLVEGRSVQRGRQAAGLVERFASQPQLIPATYWFVSTGPQDSEGGEQLLMRGAVLVKVTGRKPGFVSEGLSRELAAALAEKPVNPGRELFSALRGGGSFASFLFLTSLAIAAASVIVEAVLLRGVFDITRELGLVGQRVGAMGAMLLFTLAILLLELPLVATAARLGRHIENRLRLRFLEKIPKLEDRYFQSRLTSDMAERSHAAKRLRNLPDGVRQLLRALFELGFTAAAITWLEPSSTVFVWLIAASALLPVFLTQPALAERDLRVRSHAAGLTRFYLDAMLGLLAIRAHGGERHVMREHGKRLAQWARASLGLQRLVVFAEAVQLVAMFGLLGALLLRHPFAGTDVGRLLLLVYWALNLPVLGQEASAQIRQYPYYRTLTLRLLDPLGAPETPASARNTAVGPSTAAPAIEFRDVSVEVSGHVILDQISLRIEPRSHIAVIGPSGAGKSSLVSLLLGWLTPTAGEILLDGKALDVESLRTFTAWVDPAVQIWNRSLLSNVAYGADSKDAAGEAIDRAMLRTVLENLPNGMQTRLGEGGALVSGGEGQRVRFARALLRTGVKLVILDEPFRGLDRETRRKLLERAREHWRDATLICITHDVSETRRFDEVLVIEGGRLIEQGAPEHLVSRSGSRYAELLAAEEQTLSEIWGGKLWRRIQVRSGCLVEEVPYLEQRSPRAEVA